MAWGVVGNIKGPKGDVGLSLFNVRDYGAVGNGTTDDGPAIRRAINAAMSEDKGGIVYFPAGVYKTNRMLVPAKGIGPYDSAEGWWADAEDDQTLIFQGAGPYSSTIKAGVSFDNGGLISYGSSGTNPKIAQVICRDLTLDGNYSGVDGGAIAAVGANQPALVCIGYPHASISSSVRSGQWHYFENCRFYRPSGFTFQVLKGSHITGCDFDQVGQPNVGAPVHYDTLGGGEGDLIAIGNTWRNSKGNYVDMVNPNASLIIRAVFMGNTSVNHDEGGVYAAGQGSVIVGNTLHNNTAGGGVGYDVGTHASARSKNLVYGNNLTNLAVFASGLSSALGDLVFGNISSDSTAGVAEHLGGVEVEGALTVAGVASFGDIVTLDSVAADPASPPNGSLWYRSNTHEVRARINGAMASLHPIHNIDATADVATSINTNITAISGLSMTLPVGVWSFEAEVFVLNSGTPSCTLTVSPAGGPTCSSLSYDIVRSSATANTGENKTAFNSASTTLQSGIFWKVKGKATVTVEGTLSISMTRSLGTSAIAQPGSYLKAHRI